MTIHSDHTFTPADAALLSENGFCVGYNIDAEPDRAMAVHPTTGMIVRKFWSGCSIWHPSLKRTSESVSGGANAMERCMNHQGRFSRDNRYAAWHKRAANIERLAGLKDLAAS